MKEGERIVKRRYKERKEEGWSKGRWKREREK
jgi:hypothetical protein